MSGSEAVEGAVTRCCQATVTETSLSTFRISWTLYPEGHPELWVGVRARRGALLAVRGKH